MTNGGYVLHPVTKAEGLRTVVLCNHCAVTARKNGEIQNYDLSNIITDEACTWCGDSPNPAKVAR